MARPPSCTNCARLRADRNAWRRIAVMLFGLVRTLIAVITDRVP